TVFQTDAAVDRLQVAVHLAGLGGDAAVHLVDVDALGRHRAGGQQQRQGEGNGKARGGHGGLRMRRCDEDRPWAGGLPGGTQVAPASLQSHLSIVTGPFVVPEAARAARPKPVVLLILDGWGHRDDPADNALAQARLPNWRRLWNDNPHTLI